MYTKSFSLAIYVSTYLISYIICRYLNIFKICPHQKHIYYITHIINIYIYTHEQDQVEGAQDVLDDNGGDAQRTHFVSFAVQNQFFVCLLIGKTFFKFFLMRFLLCDLEFKM